MSFNIFETQRTSKGTYTTEAIQNKVLLIYTILSKILYGDKEHLLETNEARQIIENGIKKYYQIVNKRIEETGQPYSMNFTDFVEKFIEFFNSSENAENREFMNISSFKLLTTPYCKGGNDERLLNGELVFDISKDRFVVFDVDAIRKNKRLLNIVSVIVVDIVEQKLASLPTDVRKSFIIDEALDFLTGQSMGTFIAEMYRKIRKMGGEVIIAMQDAKFLSSCTEEVKNSIAANAAYKVILGFPTEESRRDGQIIMGLTDKEIELINKVTPKREAFIKIGGDARIRVANELSPEALAVFTTDPQELSVIRNYNKKYPTPIVAINNYINDYIYAKNN